MIQTYNLMQAEFDRLLKKKKSALIRLEENERSHQEAQDIFHKEQADVEKLEKQSLSSFIYNLIGNYEDKIEKEKQDLINAKIELDTAASLHLDAIEEVEALDRKIDILKTEMANLREELKRTDEQFKEKITQKEQEYVELKDEEKELDEAIRAGENVLNTIDRVLAELDSANSMATVDMFTDSFLIGMMKFNRIDKAEAELNYLDKTLDRYKKELKDVDLESTIAYEELSQMNRAFDIFFDNIFSDWNTKDTIQRNVAMLEDMLYEVEDVQDLLYERKRNVDKKIQSAERYL